MPVISFLENPLPEQIDQIILLYQAENWWEPIEDEAGFIRRLIAGSHCFAIATLDNEIVGMGRAISDGVSDAYIQDITVKSSQRGKDLGSGIIRKIVDRLNDDGIHWIGLISEKDSHLFYEKLGFQEMAGAIPMLKKDFPAVK